MNKQKGDCSYCDGTTTSTWNDGDDLRICFPCLRAQRLQYRAQVAELQAQVTCWEEHPPGLLPPAITRETTLRELIALVEEKP